MGGLPRVVVESGGGQESLYVYGQGLAFEVRPDGSHRYYHSDALGSTRVVTEDAGNPVSAYNYDAYGSVRAQVGEGRGFTYTGEQFDTETSMVFLRARYYDPGTGRFTGRDSIVLDPTNSQDHNRYGYVRGNPTNRVDPSGHWVETAWDVANVGWDYYEFQQDPSLINGVALAVDAVAAVVPFVPGGAGLAVRTGKAVAQIGNRAADVAGVTSQSIARANAHGVCEFAKHGGTGAGGIEGVEKVLSGLEKHGVDVVRNATEYLQRTGKAAVYMPEQGGRGVVLVGSHTEYGDVLHEARHFGQNRAAGFPGTFSERETALKELEAYEYELRNAAQWGYSERAMQNLRNNIETYSAILRSMPEP